jgi:hypothetical protein
MIAEFQGSFKEEEAGFDSHQHTEQELDDDGAMTASP